MADETARKLCIARADYFAKFQRDGELAWVKGAASFDRAALQGIPHIDGYIEEISVPGIRFDTLLEQTAFGHVHLLQIDTEGFDYDIIKLFDIAKRRPEIVHFEHKMLSERDLNECLNLFIEQSYLLTQIGGEDTLAYLAPKSIATEDAENAQRNTERQKKVSSLGVTQLKIFTLERGAESGSGGSRSRSTFPNCVTPKVEESNFLFGLISFAPLCFSVRSPRPLWLCFLARFHR